MSVSLYKAFIQGMTDYITKHNSNYTLIETTLNYLLGMVGAASSDIAVPAGLKEIFDRKGLIGVGSYSFNEGVLTGPGYNLTIASGAYWSGPTALFKSKSTSLNIAMGGFATGTYFVYLDSTGNPVVGAAALTDTIWQFDWDLATKTISAKTLYSGIAILFSGDDYATQLTSITRSKSFTQVADRLEEIEQLLAAMSGFYAEDPANHSGLDFAYLGGKVRNDSAIFVTVAGSTTLANNTTNYVEVDPASGVITDNTVGFTAGQIPLFIVVTSGGIITGVTDERTWASAGGGGGGGGHTQNTDTGTSSPSFTLNSDKAGVPDEICSLAVERGDELNVAIRWNEEVLRWQYTNDGTNWYNLGDVSLDLGSQELSKVVIFDDPEEVWTESNRGASIDWEDLDLSSKFDTPQGCAGIILRVFFWDTAPGMGVNVQFKKKDGAGLPALANSSWKDEFDPRTILVGVNDDLIAQFFVNASGADTANIRIFLVGYFEKVVGVGTQNRVTSLTDLTVPALSSVTWNLTGFLNRGLCHYLKVEETGGVLVGSYNIEIYAKDTFLAADLVYKATLIDPAVDYEDWMPFWVHDDDETRELHLKLINNDSHQGIFSVTLKSEQFA